MVPLLANSKHSPFNAQQNPRIKALALCTTEMGLEGTVTQCDTPVPASDHLHWRNPSLCFSDVRTPYTGHTAVYLRERNLFGPNNSLLQIQHRVDMYPALSSTIQSSDGWISTALQLYTGYRSELFWRVHFYSQSDGVFFIEMFTASDMLL